MKKIIIASIIVTAVLYSAMSGEIEARSNDGFEQSTFNNIEITIQELRPGDWRLSSDTSTHVRMKNKNRNRSFSFYKEGMVMVFIGTNDYDRMSKSTGSRTYRLLPFRETVKPSFARVDDNTIEGMSPTGHKVTFSAESGDVSAIEGFTVSTTPLEHFDEMVKKKGGVEIKPQKGFLLIDYGWMTGSSANSRIWTSPVIYDGMGNKCQVKNSELAMQDPNDRDEVILKYKTNGDMEKFLKKRCPSLSLQ